MKWPYARISKALALLTVALLPLQQCFAATCCCLSRQPTQHTSPADHDTCCSQKQTSCCHSMGVDGRSRWQVNWSDSESKPCHYPAGTCCDKKPDAVVPATSASSVSDEFASAAKVAPADVTANDTAATFRLTPAPPGSPSGSELCITLCHYRL